MKFRIKEEWDKELEKMVFRPEYKNGWFGGWKIIRCSKAFPYIYFNESDNLKLTERWENYPYGNYYIGETIEGAKFVIERYKAYLQHEQEKKLENDLQAAEFQAQQKKEEIKAKFNKTKIHNL